MKSKVALLSCPRYEVEDILAQLKNTVKENPDWLAGMEKGTSVFLKVNLLMKKRPEEVVTTHPALVEAVVLLLQERGARVLIGDSPGGPYTISRLKGIYRAAGLEDVAKSTGAELNTDIGETLVSYPAGKVARSFYLTNSLLQVDRVISLSKLKTHMMTKYTGAVKNLFGAIPGLRKADYHLKMPRVSDFADLLIDLALCVNPSLHIMDGIVGMEGKGPSGGSPREVGAVLVSTDPFALDVVATSLVGMEPATIPTITQAKVRGLAASLKEVELSGRPLQEWQIKPFLAPKISGNVKFPIPDFITDPLRPKPIFDANKCIACGECVHHCPPKALVIKGKLPEVNMKNCIRCFCCQELCPKHAVDIKRHPLGRFLER